MILVIDPSVATKWFLSDEKNAAADRILDRITGGDDAWAPEIFRWEIQSALLTAQRASRIDAEETAEALRMLRDLPVRLDTTGERFMAGAELQLATVYGLSIYDAAYLACAADIGAELVTADGALEHAGRDLGLSTTLIR